MLNRIKLIEELKRDEGFRGRPYKDTVGKLSIGYGRNLDDVGISSDEAEYLLKTDIDVAEEGLYRALPWVKEKPEVIVRALVNMTFNMGITSLLGFKNSLKLIEDSNYKQAGIELRKSKWYKQVGARAERIISALEQVQG